MPSRWKAGPISRPAIGGTTAKTLAAVIAIVTASASHTSPAGAADRIGGVEWTGIKLLSTDDLSKGSLLRAGASFSPGLLENELARIDSVLFSYGLLGAEVSIDTFITERGTGFRIDVAEGSPAVIRKMSLSQQAGMVDAERLKAEYGIAEGSVFLPGKLGAASENVLGIYNDAGYPFAQVWITGFDYDRGSGSVEISMSVYEGEAGVISGVVFEGLSRTDSTVALRTSRLKTGRPCRERDIGRARIYLENSGLFRSAGKPRVVRSGGGLVDIIMPVVEKDHSNRFQGAFGFSKKDGSEYGMNGSIELVLGNIAGTGRGMGLDWLNDGEKYSRTEIKYTEPFLLSSRVALDAEIRQVIHDTLYDMTSGGLYLKLPVNPGFSVSGGAAGDRTINRSGAASRSTRQRYRVGFELDTGSRFSAALRLEGAWKNTFTEGEGEDGEAQLLYRFEGSLDLPLFTRQGFHAGLVSESVFARGAIPVSEMYPIGGARTLRGYRENQFRGEKIGYLNLEYRFGGESRLFLFDDVGAWYRQDSGWSVKNGMGFGIRSVSPIGTMELSFGVGDKISLQGTRIHVSLIENF